MNKINLLSIKNDLLLKENKELMSEINKKKEDSEKINSLYFLVLQSLNTNKQIDFKTNHNLFSDLENYIPLSNFTNNSYLSNNLIKNTMFPNINSNFLEIKDEISLPYLEKTGELLNDDLNSINPIVASEIASVNGDFIDKNFGQVLNSPLIKSNSLKLEKLVEDFNYEENKDLLVENNLPLIDEIEPPCFKENFVNTDK